MYMDFIAQYSVAFEFVVGFRGGGIGDLHAHALCPASLG
jgi:hypothetical protein